MNFKLLSSAVIALSALVPTAVEANTIGSTSNLEIYFNQGLNASEAQNWAACEDNLHKWLLLSKDQPGEKVNSVVDVYAGCLVLNGADYFSKGLQLWESMPKTRVNGQFRFKASHWEKISPYFETSLRKAISSTQLKPENAFSWYTKGVSEYHLAKFSDACESLKTAKALYEKQGDKLDGNTAAVLKDACRVSSIPDGVRVSGQLRGRTHYGTTSQAYNENLRDKAQYAEKCHVYGTLKYHHYNQCTGTFERSESYYR